MSSITLRTRVAGVFAALVLGVTTIGAGQMTLTNKTRMPAADLRVGLNTLLTEHVYLASSATGAALGGRAAEFQAAAGALDQNSIALAKTIGSVYGSDAETAFLGLWRKHIGMVVDYTTGLSTKDKGKQDKAVQDLLGYATDLGVFLNAACPNLAVQVVADLVRGHTVTLKAVIDAQASHDPALYAQVRSAAGHMQMIADPLAAGIAKQFPDRFASR